MKSSFASYLAAIVPRASIVPTTGTPWSLAPRLKTSSSRHATGTNSVPNISRIRRLAASPAPATITRRFWFRDELPSVLILRTMAHKRAPANPAAVMIASSM